MNPRKNQNYQQSYLTDFLDLQTMMVGQTLSKIGNQMDIAATHQKELREAIKSDPAQFVHIGGFIEKEKVNPQGLRALSKIAAYLVALRGDDFELAQLQLKYEAGVTELLANYSRTNVDGILATVLGDDKAKQFSPERDKKQKQQKFKKPE
ncbi:MAG: hypothetical protein ACTSPO_14090 [Candidatus Heimdallarchaeaceae archaeon]